MFGSQATQPLSWQALSLITCRATTRRLLHASRGPKWPSSVGTMEPRTVPYPAFPIVSCASESFTQVLPSAYMFARSFWGRCHGYSLKVLIKDFPAFLTSLVILWVFAPAQPYKLTHELQDVGPATAVPLSTMPRPRRRPLPRLGPAGSRRHLELLMRTSFGLTDRDP